MSREIKDWDNLSDEDIAFLKMRGNPADLNRAGLMDGRVDYGLENVPGSLQEYELKNEGMPTNDIDGKIAESSEGSEPTTEHPVINKVEDPKPPAPVSAQAAPKAAATPKASAPAKA